MIANRFSYLHCVDIGLFRFNSPLNRLEILVIERQAEPFKGQWALPGVVIDGTPEAAQLQANLLRFYEGSISEQALRESMRPFFEDSSKQKRETMETALDRLIMGEKMGLDISHIEQIYTTDTTDPRGSSSSTIYMGFTKDTRALKSSQRFVPLLDVLNGQIQLAFSHNEMVSTIYQRLVAKTKYSSLPIFMLDDLFTVQDVVDVVNTIMQADLNPTSQRVRLETLMNAGYVELTELKSAQSMGRKKRLMRLLRNEPYFFDRAISTP